jgi:DNA-binding response OmpR family regulator
MNTHLATGVAPPSQPARILVVDDERHNRRLLEVMLEPEGYLLMTAACGEDALALVAQQPPDLILLDVMMPGMDGYKVAAKIKGNLATRSIRIIMLTALDDHNSRTHGLRAGAEAFLTKPVNRAELCARVRDLLRHETRGATSDGGEAVMAQPRSRSAFDELVERDG